MAILYIYEVYIYSYLYATRSSKTLIGHAMLYCTMYTLYFEYVITHRFIVVDLLPDEAGEFVQKCRASELSFIPLVSPTTTDGKYRSNALYSC
jgi:Tryptophan synthase alpha chain